MYNISSAERQDKATIISGIRICLMLLIVLCDILSFVCVVIDDLRLIKFNGRLQDLCRKAVGIIYFDVGIPYICN